MFMVMIVMKMMMMITLMMIIMMAMVIVTIFLITILVLIILNINISEHSALHTTCQCICQQGSDPAVAEFQGINITIARAILKKLAEQRPRYWDVLVGYLKEKDGAKYRVELICLNTCMLSSNPANEP